MEQKVYRVLIKSEDRKGIVQRVSTIFLNYNLNIISNNEFVDRDSNLFFMRTEVSGIADIETLQSKLQAVVPEGDIRVVDASQKKKVVILVTKEAHCIGDILMRYISDELNSEIVKVIGNYDTLEPLVSKFNIPFETVSHEGLDRESHSNQILEKLKRLDFDYIVLAKYMRILPPSFVKEYREKIINIHHSFLPAFIGANPYRQAFQRGVKIIGATAHFVTDDLDEGPIIMQDVINVDHKFSWRDMQQAGRDVEKIVLSNALKLVLEDRVFIYNNRTVIF
jgi:formyltetrahydrofolate deformylase